MLWLSALVLAATPQPAPTSAPAGVTVQARATVRIIAGARIAFASQGAPDQPPLRDRLIHLEGKWLPVRIVDFE